MLFGLLPTIFIAFLTDRAAKLALSVILLLAPPNQVLFSALLFFSSLLCSAHPCFSSPL